VKQWLDKLNGAMCSFRAPEVTRRYLEALRTAANAATSATTGEGLAPYGPLEDTIRLMLQEAMANKDAEAGPSTDGCGMRSALRSTRSSRS
jgi:hypothetical protein